MAGQLSIVEFIRGCSDALAFGTTPTAITPTARIISGEGKTMHTATKRAVIAAAGLAAAGLFGSLPYDGSSLAQQGTPRVQHHDVALVDVTSPIVASEIALDDQLFNSVFSSTGLEAELYNGLATALGGGATGDALATELLDATGASPIYSGDFDGALSRLEGGVLFDTWAGESELNSLLGVTPADGNAAILADITKDFIPLPGADTLPAATDPNFAADLMTIANADYTMAAGDFDGWLANLPTALGDLGGGGGLLSGLLGDLGLGSLGDGVGSLGTDLTSLLDGLLGIL
jgi:hypothetical protein